ncbi:hypothetical protein AT6N2_C0628 [Agrobacterium tumefaciens]|nr:hypothetical protein AT6N2_C0628 [Agrobacterium tumefaciens]
MFRRLCCLLLGGLRSLVTLRRWNGGDAGIGLIRFRPGRLFLLLHLLVIGGHVAGAAGRFCGRIAIGEGGRQVPVGFSGFSGHHVCCFLIRHGVEIKLRLRSRAHFLALLGLGAEIKWRGIGGDREERSVAGAHAECSKPALGGGVGVGRKARLSRLIAILPEGIGIPGHIGRRRCLAVHILCGAAAIGIKGGENALAPDVAVIVASARHGLIAVADDRVALGLGIHQRIADLGAEPGIGIAIHNDTTGRAAIAAHVVSDLADDDVLAGERIGVTPHLGRVADDTGRFAQLLIQRIAHLIRKSGGRSDENKGKQEADDAAAPGQLCDPYDVPGRWQGCYASGNPCFRKIT